MHSNRIACVGRVRFVALGVLVGGVALAVATSKSEPEPPPEPPGCALLASRAEPTPAPVEVAAPEPELDHQVCACPAIVDGRFTTEQVRTLELACRLYSDEECRYGFQLVETPEQGDRTAVIVKRSTGDCGGCGALTVAAVFRKGTLEAIGELGRYGRFGNGPDGARFVTIAGELALELAWSESMGGYFDEYREVFLRDGDGFRSAVCVNTRADTRGAYEQPYEWRADLRYRANGTIDVRYHAIQRSDTMPELTPRTIEFDRRARRWSSRQTEDDSQCVVPHNPHLIDI